MDVLLDDVGFIANKKCQYDFQVRTFLKNGPLREEFDEVSVPGGVPRRRDLLVSRSIRSNRKKVQFKRLEMAFAGIGRIDALANKSVRRISLGSLASGDASYWTMNAPTWQ